MWLHSNNDVLSLTADEKHRLDGYYHDLNVVPPACVYCESLLQRLGAKHDSTGESVTTEVHTCPACGWWVVTNARYTSTYEAVYRSLRRCAGTLRQLDLSDISTPVAELQRYLLAKYESRFQVDPKKYDKGIDVIVFDGENGDQVGVQVKRYHGKIEAEQIRTFAGALLLNGMTRGIFVTASRFTKGAMVTAEAYAQRGLAISLWDSEAFYDKLRITRRPLFTTADEPTAPFFSFWQNPKAIPTVHEVNL
jgi:restriction system protein